MKPRKIKRFWLLGLVTMLLVIVGVALSILWPRLFPSSGVSDLYRRYEHNDHIRATEIHDFHINDTLAVETVLLQAATDSSWCALMVDFGASEEFIDFYKSNKEFFVGEGNNAISLYYVDRNNLRKRVPNSDPDSWPVILSHRKRTLCIFMTENSHIKEIIELSEIKKLKQ